MLTQAVASALTYNAGVSKALLGATGAAPYQGNYVSLPVSALKAPVEGNRGVSIALFWSRQGNPPNYAIEFNAREQRVTPLSQIASVFVDNTNNAQTCNVYFPDTQFQLVIPGSTQGFFPVVTNGIDFIAYLATTPTAQDMTVIQVLNHLPPPLANGLASPATGGALGVTEVDTALPITGGPITRTGTVGLATPLGITYGGTGATTGPAGLDALAGFSGGANGFMSRTAGGLYTLGPPTMPLRASNEATYSAPSAGVTSTTTRVHAATNISLTPQSTGVVWISFCGALTNNTAGDGADCNIRYGTGTPPINGATVGPGTALGFAVILTAVQTANFSYPFAINSIVSGLSPGTTYWFDLTFRAITGGTGNLNSVTATAMEI